MERLSVPVSRRAMPSNILGDKALDKPGTFFEELPGPEYPLKVSQSTLAEMVGTTRARVSKFMNVFKKKGLVSYNGGLQINSTLLTAFLQNRPLSVSTKA